MVNISDLLWKLRVLDLIHIGGINEEEDFRFYRQIQYRYQGSDSEWPKNTVYQEKKETMPNCRLQIVLT